MFSASHPGILTAGPELAKGHCPLHRWGSSGPQSGHYREVTRPDFNKSMWPRRHRHSPNRFSLWPSPPLTPLPPGWRAQGDCVGVSIAGPRMAPATPGTGATSSSGAEPSHLPQPAPPPPPSCLGGAAPGPSGPTHPGRPTLGRALGPSLSVNQSRASKPGQPLLLTARGGRHSQQGLLLSSCPQFPRHKMG